MNTLGLLGELEAEASPKPWRQHWTRDILQGEGTVIFRPTLTKSNKRRKPNGALTVLAVNHLRPLVEAVVGRPCRSRPTGGLDCSVVPDSYKCRRCRTLAALHKDLEAALKDVKRQGEVT